MNYRNRIVGIGEESPEQLLANPFNFRHHPGHQQAAMKGTLDEIGWVQNIIINKTTGHIIDGHLRVEVAMEKEQAKVPVVYVELSEKEEQIALASLDPIGALAEQSQEELDELLSEIGEVNNDSLQAFFDSLASNSEDDEETDGEIDDDEVPELMKETTSKPGDIWILGEHRVMCGDSLDPEQVGLLVEDTPVEMVWTDPPYNVAYEGATADALTIQNDEMSDGDFKQFLLDAFTTAFMYTESGCAIYIAHADSESLNFRSAMTEAGFKLAQNLIWVKNMSVLSRNDYHYQHEPILYGWKPGAAHKWYGEFNKKTVIDDQSPNLNDMDKNELKRFCRQLMNEQQSSVVRFDKPLRNGEHPTMKPVDLILHFLKNSSRRNDRVLDLFGGSGSTLIACEKIGRKARLMELDPIYADVIVRRWQEYTGLDAKLENTGETFNSLSNDFAEIAPAE